MTEYFNPFSLKGKTIVVTGASSGIGRQTAVDCTRMGARVILIARNRARLYETYSILNGEDNVIIEQDVNDLAPNFIDELVVQYGQINGFVHCAGIEVTQPVKFLRKKDYENVMSTNVYSAFEIIRQLVNKKNLSNNGSIVLISSISSLIGRMGLTAYAASKGALLSAVRVMALEMAKRKIRVNAISPGTILTPMMSKAMENLTEEQRTKRIEDFPLGLGNTEDISNACVYLLSDASRWVTGQNLIIDGGYTAR